MINWHCRHGFHCVIVGVTGTQVVPLNWHVNDKHNNVVTIKLQIKMVETAAHDHLESFFRRAPPSLLGTFCFHPHPRNMYSSQFVDHPLSLHPPTVPKYKEILVHGWNGGVIRWIAIRGSIRIFSERVLRFAPNRLKMWFSPSLMYSIPLLQSKCCLFIINLKVIYLFICHWPPPTPPPLPITPIKSCREWIQSEQSRSDSILVYLVLSRNQKPVATAAPAGASLECH